MRVIDVDGHEKTTLPTPRGLIVAFSGAAIPTGWLLCDGTLGTPDLRDRFIIGDTAVGTGTAGGSVSATAALTHSGAAVGAHSVHAVTQASAHSNHVITQPGVHTSHVVTQAGAHATHAANTAHTHDAHVGVLATAGSAAVIGATTHAAQGAHTHDAHDAHLGANLDAHSAHSAANLDAHSAHGGATVDAHSAHGVTQPSAHAILQHYVVALIMFSGVA